MLASLLCFRVGSLLAIYLGLPLGVTHRSCVVLEERLKGNWPLGRSNTSLRGKD